MSASKSFNAGLRLPVSRIARFLRKGRRFRSRRSSGAGPPVCLAAVLEFMATQVLEGAMEDRKSRIVPKHVLMAVMNDEELWKLLDDITFADDGIQFVVASDA